MAMEQIDELFAQTLRGDYDDDAPWQSVRALQRMGTREVCDRAVEWCRSEDELRRARGADILAQIGKTAEHPSNAFPEDSYAAISRMLRRENHARPLNSAISALGHLGNPAAAALLIENQVQFHPSPDVRCATAFALGSFADDPNAIAVLLLLMRDPDDDVRDWATFGLGTQSDSDCEEIRDTLLRRVSDSNENVREEAIVGLSRRKDTRVLPALIVELQQPDVTRLTLEAAREMLGMQEDREDWSGDDYVAALRERFPIYLFA
jgi:HEAT repeat protein